MKEEIVYNWVRNWFYSLHFKFLEIRIQLINSLLFAVCMDVLLNHAHVSIHFCLIVCTIEIIIIVLVLWEKNYVLFWNVNPAMKSWNSLLIGVDIEWLIN